MLIIGGGATKHPGSLCVFEGVVHVIFEFFFCSLRVRERHGTQKMWRWRGGVVWRTAVPHGKSSIGPSSLSYSSNGEDESFPHILREYWETITSERAPSEARGRDTGFRYEASARLQFKGIELPRAVCLVRATPEMWPFTLRGVHRDNRRSKRDTGMRGHRGK